MLPATPTPSYSYEIQSGDTLWSIAERAYGNSNDWPTIASANSWITNPDLIFTGWRLYIPKHSAGYSPRHAVASDPVEVADTVGGSLSCSGLESLWDAAGGNPTDASYAASVAMAESSGQQFATGPYGERGYWQINPAAWGTLATYNPIGNAQAAVRISDNGNDWAPWTDPFVEGLEQGACS